MNEVTLCTGLVSTNASCAGVTRNGRIDNVHVSVNSQYNCSMNISLFKYKIVPRSILTPRVTG